MMLSESKLYKYFSSQNMIQFFSITANSFNALHLNFKGLPLNTKLSYAFQTTATMKNSWIKLFDALVTPDLNGWLRYALLVTVGKFQ